MDTFFTVVGGLFILNLIYELIKLLTGDAEDWQLYLAEDVLNWCLYLYPIRKQKPPLRLVEDESHLAGDFVFICPNFVTWRLSYFSIGIFPLYRR